MQNQIVQSARTSCLFILSFAFLLCSCSFQKKIARSAKENVLSNPSLQTAHVGISIYEPATGKYWYDYQGDKYFVPASNTKIPTCYAAMKYLGDSLAGLKYGYTADKLIVLQPTGDPSFLLKEYVSQPVADFLEKKLKTEKLKAAYLEGTWQDQQWGSGWSWNDYDETYMAERSPFPVFGNTIDIELNDPAHRFAGDSSITLFKTGVNYFDTVINRSIPAYPRAQFRNAVQNFTITRDISRNSFDIKWSRRPFDKQSMPFTTKGATSATGILEEMFATKFAHAFPSRQKGKYQLENEDASHSTISIDNWYTVHSQPTDSLLKPMMHRSDNFFAEQSLLMVSNEVLGVMSDEKIIDTLLKTVFSDLPQKPRWVDGSGLSRYNLFTPQDFIAILNKMKNEFGMERIKVILPTGGEGTISSYYQADRGYIFVKTGTLSGVVALSGFLTTKKNRQLIFSALINNHQASATEVRKALEKFLQGIRNAY